MFTDGADTSCLRQGDILKGIPFPLIKLDQVVILGKPASAAGGSFSPITEETSLGNWHTAHVPIHFSYCAIVTQCCDLALNPQGKMFKPSFTISRLIVIPDRVRKDAAKLASLKANKNPSKEEGPGYIQHFYIEPHALLGGTDWVVDYNQTMTIRSADYQTVLANKILQLDDRTRVKFKLKLGICMARLTDEEVEANLEDPWN